MEAYWFLLKFYEYWRGIIWEKHSLVKTESKIFTCNNGKIWFKSLTGTIEMEIKCWKRKRKPKSIAKQLNNKVEYTFFTSDIFSLCHIKNEINRQIWMEYGD